MAWLTGDWFSYSLVTSFLGLVLVPFYWLSPESPRLRLTQNRVPEAEKIIRTIKRVNREPVPDDLTEQLEEIAAEISKEKKSGIWCLLTSRQMAKFCFLFCLTW